MPPEGYTAVTITEETADKLDEIVADYDLGSLGDAVEFATDAARDPEDLSEAELARVLYQRLSG